MTKDEEKLVRFQLERLHQGGGGTFTAQQVVDIARPPKSPLHRFFEWNDATAGDAYRLVQAGRLIRTVRVTVRTATDTLRTPVYVRQPETERGYTTILSLRADDSRARSALMTEFAYMRGALTRARMVAVVLGMESEVDAVLASVVALHTRIQAAVPVLEDETQ